MQLNAAFPAFAILLLLLFGAAPARAQVCTLALGTGGLLDLSADGMVLGSGEGLGASGTITILSVGTNTINIDAPTRVGAAPAGYQTATETVEISYSGLGDLSFVDQPYTSAATGFAVGTIALSILEIDNRILNPAGFAPGGYTTRTVVTCN